MRGMISWILEVWRPIRIWVAVLFLLTVVSTAVAIAYPLVFRYFLDLLAEEGGRQAPGISPAVRGAIAVFVIVGVLRLFSSFYPATRAHINYLIERQVRDRYFAFILRKGYGFFQRFRTGDLVTRLTDDITDYPRIAWFCCSGIFRAVESGSKLVFCLAVMTWLDWRLTLLSIAPLPVMILIFVRIHGVLGRRTEAQREAVSETSDLLESSFEGVRIIKAHNAEDRQGDALRRQLDGRIGVETGVALLTQAVESLYQSLNAVGQVIVVAVGGILVIRGHMSVGTFYAFYTYLGMLVAPLLDLPNLFVTGRQAFVNIQREEEIRLADAEGEGGAFRGARAEPAGARTASALEFRGVRFAYPMLPAVPEPPPGTRPSGRHREAAPAARPLVPAGPLPLGPEVLHGVDLALRPGERVAVVGRVGAGKSTLLRIAAGRLVPTAGTVQVDGLPVAAHDPAAFGRAVAVVPQEPVLFSESIRENVVFGRAADDARLEDVLDAVGILDEVRALPQGVDQVIGQRGITLSGGQRQRLSIARALYGRPRILLLDDLTSALDAENEDRLWHRLEVLLPDASLLVVTHRVATARALDRIVVLDAGRIAAEGSHDHLVAASPLYQGFQHRWVEPAAV